MQGPFRGHVVLLTKSNSRTSQNLFPILSIFPAYNSGLRHRCCPDSAIAKRVSQTRNAHTRRNVSSTAVHVTQEDSQNGQPRIDSPPSDLACLPLVTLVRSYLITAMSSYPMFLKPSLSFLSFLAHSEIPLLNPDKSPILRLLLKKTFYAQFCAGETSAEVEKTLAGLKNMGYKGVILGHAREVVLSAKEAEELDSSKDTEKQANADAGDILTWKQNTLATIELAQKDDYVALKFSGAGRQALRHLKATIPCAPAFEEAVHEICRRAAEKHIGLLFDAEQASLQHGIDNWTMYFAKIYNKGKKALVYGTYQAYAKRTPEVLADHLDQAREQGFVLGVKLVRGAYLGSDPRHLFWPNIEGTHKCYDGIAESLIKRQYGTVLKAANGKSSEFPQVNFVLASHNAESIKRAQILRDEQARKGEPRTRMAYGQLMGMADNVSCQLVRSAQERLQIEDQDAEIPKAYKYLVWGKMGECMRYLVRRAQENRDAVTRTVDARQALGKELGRRMGLLR